MRRRVAEKAECGDYERQRARSSSDNFCVYFHHDQPGIDLGTSAATALAARTYTLPAPPSPTVSKHSAHLQQTGITPFVEQVEHIAKVVQPALPPTIATDDVTCAVAAPGRLGAATPGLRVALACGEQGTAVVQVEDMGGHDASSWSRTVR